MSEYEERLLESLMEARKRTEELDGIIVRMADDIFLLKKAIRKHRDSPDLKSEEDIELWKTIQ